MSIAEPKNDWPGYKDSRKRPRRTCIIDDSHKEDRRIQSIDATKHYRQRPPMVRQYEMRRSTELSKHAHRLVQMQSNAVTVTTAPPIRVTNTVLRGVTPR